jgi:hypothetical protein
VPKGISRANLSEIIGFRGEKLAELALTEYSEFQKPLFRPGFLGDKWPAIDFYVELTAVKGKRPYFFAQCKSTGAKLGARTKALRIRFTPKAIKRLREIPGPTYLLAVHEPTKRVFVRAIHSTLKGRATASVKIANELTPKALRLLHAEVAKYWSAGKHKPTESNFV